MSIRTVLGDITNAVSNVFRCMVTPTRRTRHRSRSRSLPKTHGAPRKRKTRNRRRLKSPKTRRKNIRS